MSAIWMADRVYDSACQIDPDSLRRSGIRLLLSDLDNTLAPYESPLPDEDILAWNRKLQESGVRLFLVSNNRSDLRVRRFAEALDIGFVSRAGKPGRRGLMEAMERCGATPAETAMLGDMTYTDIIGGKRCGFTALLVRPITIKGHPFRCLRYWLELPVRKLASGKRLPGELMEGEEEAS